MKVVFFSPFNNEDKFSQEDLVKKQIPIGIIYLVDEPDKAWGDDWDDNPSSCNAGPPYGDNVKPVVLKYGAELPTKGL